MLPDVIDNTSFKYLKVDEKYIRSLSIKALPENIYFLDIIKDMPGTICYDLSMYISKIDPIKALNDITFNIGVVQSELDTINKNQRNIDVVNKSKEDAAILRKKIQIENQELYTISIIITFYSYNLNQLNKYISTIKSKFYSKGIISEVTNFRHINSYLSNLPLKIQNSKSLNNMYLTTDAISNIFPFYSNTFYDKGGVIVGYTTQNRICCLNIFSNKYENANMCIFGCSGSGKSFFTKLFILRNFFLNKVQIIFDIEGEYEKLAKNLDGEILFKNSYYNILEFNTKEIEEDDYYIKKIDKVVKIILSFCSMDEDYLREKIEETYTKFNITDDKSSIVVAEDENNIFLDYKIRDRNSFPTLYDLLEVIEDNTQKDMLKKVLENELRFFSRITNINTNKKVYILSTREIIKYPLVICKILNSILDDYLGDNETIIYIDEMWKYSTCEEILETIFNMYKTIRKRKASIISITQDISDFFEYKDGAYANSILNNSAFKMFFKTNYSNLKDKVMEIDFNEFSKLKKGEGIISIGQNNIKLNIKANNFEGVLLDENDCGNKQ